MTARAVSRILDILPARARMRCGPEAALAAVHGVVAGAWRCPDCGTVYELAHYPAWLCAGCGRPLPRRCIRHACTGAVEPVRVDGIWYDGGPVCAACADEARRRQRSQAVLGAVRRADAAAGVPDRCCGHYEAAWRDVTSHYWPRKHRRALDFSLAGWLDAIRTGNGARALYAWGSVGAGKTCAIVRAAGAAMTEGIVTSLFVTTEYELLELARRRYRDDGEAEQLWRGARGVDLLVVDELFARREGAYRRAGGEESASGRALGELFRRRIEAHVPTLFAGNEPLTTRTCESLWAVVFDARLASRWKGAGTDVACNGVDLRRPKRALEVRR